MTAFLLILRLVVVVVFFVMFLRRPNVTWGVGLLTVTTAVLMDAYITILGGAEAVEALGFFRSVLEGALLGGAAAWVLGLVRPFLPGAAARPAAARPSARAEAGTGVATPPEAPDATVRPANQPAVVTDRQQLYDQIRHRLGREDVLDLIFDLGLSENDVVGLDGEISQAIVRLMDLAESRGRLGELALAVERILSPLPAESLPRREKLTVDTPPTLLRQFLLVHCDLARLQAYAGRLEIDWEQLTGGKKDRVRGMLLYLTRRNRLQELIDLLQATADAAEPG